MWLSFEQENWKAIEDIKKNLETCGKLLDRYYDKCKAVKNQRPQHLDYINQMEDTRAAGRLN